MMPAYMIVRMDVTDMEQYKEYMKLTPDILKKYGGKFVIRGAEKNHPRRTGNYGSYGHGQV